ncbi:MAG: 16S rRNA (cytosine(967)-C(5))-methyltransferase RsmB [Thiotrichales bacterium]|nr:16S rRNA (cytosine(967)-C(5))-methyltransferase RsmB [Thiotrichales bacterium]MCY4350516.1 16S rRNA (cytosine(967)-C(5))-methyltransferase RsmB [Thiotrichales bacterium]
MSRKRPPGVAWRPRRSARNVAHALLTGVLRDGRSLGASARGRFDARLDPRERAFAQELVFGTLRHLPRLEAWLAHITPRPPEDAGLRALALLGLYQLAFTRVPSHAAVNTSVELARSIGKSWAAGFVNATLRRFATERDAIERMELAAPARLSHPSWLLAEFEHAWPDAWESIARANLERPPMTLRVGTDRIARQDYIGALSKRGIAARATRHSASGVILEAPCPVERLPGFDDGLVSVQDEAAQLAATLLDTPQDGRVLDACAAPGGKTGHMLELGADGLELVALDNAPRRIEDLRKTLSRLGFTARVALGDAGKPRGWWDGRPFDCILLDAPCSGTGVIRRRPDIKLLRRPGDIDVMVERQGAMLRALWPLLVRGGRLLYATCSVLPRENERVVESFLATRADAAPVRIDAAWGRPTGPGRQILPGDDAMDGFFYAALAKR